MARKNLPGESDQENPDADIQNSPGTIEVDRGNLDDCEVTDFEDLFGDGTESITVELYRLKPKIWNDLEIGGFVASLSPNTTKQDICDAYGGGTYLIRSRKVGDGTFRVQRRLQVAGAPRMIAPPGRTTEPGNQMPVPVTVNGQELNLNDPIAKIEHMMVIKAALDAAVPQKETISDQLIAALLKRSDVAPVSLSDQLAQLAGLLSGLREVYADTGGGSDNGNELLGLGKEVVKAFSSLVTARHQPALSMDEYRPPAPAQVGDGNGEQAENQAAQPAEDVENMSIEDKIKQAAGLVVEGYDQRKTPKITCDAIDYLLKIPQEVKIGLAGKREVIEMISVAAYKEMIGDDPQEVIDFRAYFNQVFDVFTGEKKPLDKKPKPS